VTSNSYEQELRGLFRIFEMANHTPSASPSKIISKDEWEQRLAQVKLTKVDLNKLVMNYLVIEGYKDAAEKFQRESGTEPLINLNSITDRMAIRHAIHNGNVEEGIQRVNNLNPKLLQTNPVLRFHLQQQKLIELIRNGAINEALDFAQKELAPLTEEHPQFLEELEKTLALLAFEDQTKSPLSFLLDDAQRQKTASELNAAILTDQHQEKDPKLLTLVKMMKWSQNQLEERIGFPKINDITTGTLEEHKES